MPQSLMAFVLRAVLLAVCATALATTLHLQMYFLVGFSHCRQRPLVVIHEKSSEVNKGSLPPVAQHLREIEFAHTPSESPKTLAKHAICARFTRA